MATEQFKNNSKNLKFINHFKSIPHENVLIVMALGQESQNRLEALGLSVFYCGIGSLNATLNLTQILESFKSQNIKVHRVLNLGTAGAFSGPYLTSSDQNFLEISTCVRRGVILDSMNKKIILNPLTDIKKAICASADYIENFDVNQKYEFDLMDMESYSLAYVCEKYQIQFNSFKFITDTSNQNTLNDWKKNLQKAQDQFVIFCKSLS